MPWGDLSFVDPEDGSPLRAVDGGLVSETGRRYEFVDGQPNLLPRGGLELGRWRFPAIVVDDAARPRPTSRSRRLAVRVKAWLEPAGDRRCAVAEMRRVLTEEQARPELLVVGGASVGEGLEQLLADDEIRVTSFDIYPTSETTFVADAHRIPLADGSVGAVVVQAVLEHVYRPEVVVSEIRRVLRPGGLVYAETPFLQPVHEGAYDFTRFTVSGHRLLFEGFDEIESGPIGGPGALLNLALRGLVGGIARSKRLAKIAYAATLPLRALDRAIAPRWRSDYAIGAFFLGRRAGDERLEIDPVEIHR